MKIALLTTPYLEDFYKKAINELELKCEADVYVYYNYKHVIELYRQLQDSYDGFVTAGSAPMAIIKEEISNSKPINNIVCSASNFYRELFKIIYQYEDYKFEYGYFDFCDYLCPDEENRLIDWLREGKLEKWVSDNNEYINHMTPEDMRITLNRTREKHISLWKSGKIKYSLSRRSLIVPDVLEAGVNCHFIYCSYEDIYNCFESLIRTITIQKLEKNRPAVIKVSFAITLEESDKLSFKNNQENLLYRGISAFNRKFLYNFIIENSDECITIYTNYSSVKDITSSFTTCKLRSFLHNRHLEKVAIGYGLGDDLKEAMINATNALKESQVSCENNSYIINEEKDKIGLFGYGKSLKVINKVTDYEKELAEYTSLSTLTIQKIIAAQSMIGDNDFTSQDLAQILNVSARSANRILNTLVQFNLAKILYTKQSGTKGRPHKVYRLLLGLPKF
ncbi:hypothetical protein [Clostridium cadaveris]|uniref:Transcriptional regulator n=1 Tax=Clostridium cadaveris TaxID=1529 RepID=A0A316MC25_9CLOT|nr:MAG: hypothetical protein DBY38_03920 [Clostridium cadaveris]